jgi:hypothetical protein
MKTARFHCALFAGKTIIHRYGPRKVKLTFQKQPQPAIKKIHYFQRLLDSQNKQRKVSEKKVTISEKAQEASYLVAELIAQKMKSRATAESLVTPACKTIARTTIGKGAQTEIDRVPVSDNTKGA